MLTGINFQNYKAFREGHIEIKPITILLGANSVGKSSILQLILMLQQTSICDPNYKSAMKLFGGFVSMGEPKNLLRGKNEKNILSLKIEFESSELGQLLKEKLLAAYTTEILSFARIMNGIYSQNQESILSKFLSDNFTNKSETKIKSSKESLNLFFVHKLLMLSDFDKEPINKDKFYDLISIIAEVFPEEKLIDLPDEIKQIDLLGSNDFTRHLKISSKKEEYLLTYDFLHNLSDASTSKKFEISYDLVYVSKIKNFVIKSVSLYAGNEKFISFEFDESNEGRLSIISSTFFSDRKLKDYTYKGVSRLFKSNKTIFDFVPEINQKQTQDNNYSVFGNIVYRIFRGFIENVERNFGQNQINYVSPLRAHPKRYYFLDKAKYSSFLDTLDGDALAEILKDNDTLRNQVNSWLKKFGLTVKVSQLEDIIHKLTINQNFLELDITDVGFGISQVLPVIIQGFLSLKGSITLIEQPEIHLHPKMQADLADLFIDMSITKGKDKMDSINKYVIIETHSEYLLKRLRRRIAEGNISSESVAIYLIDPQTEGKGALIKKLDINQTGFFEWPIDFYGGEILNDTFEFLKKQ